MRDVSYSKNRFCVETVNQFEMKDTCFEFVINFSRQGNNEKIKLNLETNWQRLQS